MMTTAITTDVLFSSPRNGDIKPYLEIADADIGTPGTRLRGQEM